MNWNGIRKVLCLAGGMAVGTLSAGAAILTYSDSVALSPTDWSTTVSIPKFDPSFGTLYSVGYTLAGHVEGTARAENQGAAPATLTLRLRAEITLYRPDLSIIVVTIPLVTRVFSATAYDGLTDYGGTSGVTYSGLTGDNSATDLAPPPASDLTLFTGTGNILLPVDALGTSFASGSGNMSSSFTSDASATVTIQYDYMPIPEPSPAIAGAVMLLAAGGSGLRNHLRRKKAQ